MKPALMILGLLIVVGLVLWLLDRRARARGDDTPVVEPPQGCSDDCCTTHTTCPSTQMLTAECGPVTYFDLYKSIKVIEGDFLIYISTDLVAFIPAFLKCI